MASPEYAPDNSPLPEYSSSVYLQETLDTKLEYIAPTRRSFNRRWCKALVELNNTQITITPLGFRAAPPKTLSMQYAKIGFAGDYRKGVYPLRLRAQGMQFLFECHELLTSLRWIQAIQRSIAISLPLELRVEPKERYKLLRRVRRRPAELPAEPIREKEREGALAEALAPHEAPPHADSLLASDIPCNMAFNLRDFGVILNTQHWDMQMCML